MESNKYNLFGVEGVEDEEESLYTTKVSIPQYKPSAECPSVYDIYSTLKYEQLLNNINRANISAEDKEFLRLAAARHIVFNYSKIADYYAHASKEVQELMEESALVIIDIDDAIANGYVKLDKKLTQLAEEAFNRRNAKEKAKKGEGEDA